MTLKITIVVGISFVIEVLNVCAAVIPPIDLNPGDQYQLIFATAHARQGNSGNADIYNSFVSQEAEQNILLPLTSWHAIVSTTYSDSSSLPVDAKDNAPTFSNIPIYNTAGLRVANGSQGIWSGALINAIQYDQFGVVATTAGVLSGTGTNGIRDTLLKDWTSGPSSITIGNYSKTTGAWINSGKGGASFPGSVYALSDPITVPTPPAVHGDFNSDGVVDASDYVIWRKHIGYAVPRWTGGDANGNGFVEWVDYGPWRENYGSIYGSGSAAGTNATVPEPSTAVLIFLAASFDLWRRVAR